MRIGIVSFEEVFDSRTLRGISTCSRYLQQDLINVGLEVDLIVYGKRELSYPKEFKVTHHCRYIEDLKQLKSLYDFIIYFTPGRSWEKYDDRDPDRYVDVLNAVDLPFTIIYHSEEYRLHQPYRYNFIGHPQCKFLTFIVGGFEDIYKEDLEINPNYIVVSPIPPLNSLSEILQKCKSKTQSIIITSAWTNFKRNLEYFELAGEFLKLGISPYSAGSPSSNYYMNDIIDYLVSSIDIVYKEKVSTTDERAMARYKDYAKMFHRLGHDENYEQIKDDKIPKILGAHIHLKSGGQWYDYGSYFPEQIPEILSDKKYHWNMSGYKVNKTFIPRLEMVTLESFNEGCLPILCKESSPSWITEDSALIFSKKEYTDRVQELKSISDEERIRRLEKFYELVSTNLYENMFNKMKDLIESSIS